MNLDRAAVFDGLIQPTVLVMGLGESGLAMARWCAAQGCALRLADTRATPPNLEKALALGGAEHRFVSTPQAAFAMDVLDEVALVAISPGLSPLAPDVAALLAAAKAKGIPVWGELTFFAYALKALRQPVVSYVPKVLAITGTNGKTTTTALTGLLVARAGLSVAVAGNISPSMLDVLCERIASGSLPQVWVLELSSFQLETAHGFEPDVATVLNITQDHLDWHGGFETYAAAKLRIFGARTHAIVNRNNARDNARNDRHSMQWQTILARDEVTYFGTDAPARVGDFGIVNDGGLVWLAQATNADGEDSVLADQVPGDDAAPRRKRSKAAKPVAIVVKPLMPVDALRIRGMHNASNALAALAMCRAIGLSLAPLLHGLREYRGEAHRVESVANVNGVDYVDDSKATNVGATVAALDGLARRVVLIAGGDGKGQDFSPLQAAIAQWCKAVMLIGHDGPRLRETLSDCGVPLIDQPSLEAATRAASEMAESGEIVLLSPACASFDMFRNYAHRSEVFHRCVEDIAAEQGVIL